MYIEEIKWIDRENKEAILKVANDTQSLICFSCPCSYNVGNVLSDPLECLDTDDIILCKFEEDYIEKTDEGFGYKLKGKLKDLQEGIVDIYGFDIHINREKIPGDIQEGMYIQFVVSRIDVW